ncbi:MAG: CotH kinase family protein [Bacteroidales bacterium]|nr:CotH kinase family protein [Bacteroidales bacterium]
MKSKFLIFTFLLFSACLQILQAQINDTISNWDGISANWITWPGSIQVVDNPQPGVLNPSAFSIKVTTSTDPYDLMLLDLPYIVSFDQYPKYHMLCYPPAEGGDVVLKFENNDVSSWQEIRVSASGGQWNVLEFDFTGLPYNDFTRMVIFFDFLGTTAGKEWYFDDITRQSAGPLMLQSNLPIVVINTFGTEIPDDPKITAHMGIISNGEGNLNTLGDPFNNYDGNIGIEVRGQSTQMFPKKCYGFETRDNQGENLDVSLLGLPEENDWILYAPYTDKSLMRNAISYEIGHRLGEYCTRNVYCELIINNDFKGIYLTTAEKALIASTFKDPANGYLKYFDAPSFVDFMLLSEISKEVDKYRYSTYFNKQKDSHGGKLFAGPAWDFNLGYGNVDYWQPGVEYAGWLYELVNPWDGSIMFWWKRMMEDPYFRNLAKTRWTALRLYKLSNASIDALIDSITELTESARIRNFERWPILGTYVWPNYNWQGNDYEDEVAYFRTYLMNRINWMDHNFEGQVLHPAADIIAEANKITFTLRGDYFRHPIIKKGNFTLNDAPANIIIEEVLYLSPTTCTLTLSDNVTPFPEISVTVDKKIINTWDDLTSNKLATASAPEEFNRQSLEVFVSGGTIHLRCFEPGFLPPSASLYSITGQKIREYELQNVTENLLPGPAIPGIYILRLDNKHQSFSYKIIVH